MGHPIHHLIHRLELLIRQGRGRKAQGELIKLAQTKILRTELVRVAQIAWRLGLPETAIRLLNPVVQSESKTSGTASIEERAEYAIALIKIGAPEEGLSMLKGLDPLKYPQVLFYLASARFAQWDYASSIPLLQKYVASAELDSYQNLVGRVNLAAAFVHERQAGNASPLLEALLSETASKGLFLLHGNALELCAQNAIFQKRWKEAEMYLERAKNNLQDTATLDEFFVRKWEVILGVLKNGGKDLGALSKLRAEAQKKRHWETIRDCDYFEVVASQNEGRLFHLYFGTPFESYRRRLLEDFKKEPSLPDDYRWQLCPGKGSVLDLSTGELDGHNCGLKTGQLTHRALVALSMDFYHPLRLASFHFHLYPKEFFDPVSSRNRVHSVLHELKGWSHKAGIPLTIQQREQLYSLSAESAFAIRISRAEELGDKDASFIKKLKNAWPGREFTLKEAGQLLALPSRSILRILDRSQKQGKLSRTGKGRSTRYSFA